ncbi:MAG: hypothetical protein ACREEG_07055, partial [Phenylobacterium sp.]
AWPAAPDTAAEKGLQDAILAYWTQFARTGAPGTAHGVAWPRYGATPRFLRFHAEPVAGVDPARGAYALHEEAVCRRRAAGDQSWIVNIGAGASRLPPPIKGCAPAAARTNTLSEPGPDLSD